GWRRGDDRDRRARFAYESRSGGGLERAVELDRLTCSLLERGPFDRADHFLERALVHLFGKGKLHVVEGDASRHFGRGRFDGADDVARMRRRPAEVEDRGTAVLGPCGGDEDSCSVGCILELAATAPAHLVTLASRGGLHRQRWVRGQALVAARPVDDVR